MGEGGRLGTTRALAARAVALAVVCTLAVAPVSDAGASARATGTRHGAYATGAYVGPADPAGVTAFGALVGTRVRYAMEFLDGRSWATISRPQWQLSHWAGSGYSMIWAVPILPSDGSSLAAGATGAYDAHFATLARMLVGAGEGHALIRIGWEFNGIWFPWGAKDHAASFVAYWRHIVQTMRAVPGAHFTFVWNPDRGDFGVGDLSKYYPGNAYVDDVALDVYDEEWQHYPGARAEARQIIGGPYGLDWLAGFAAAHHKPMVFPEWGLGWGTCRSGAVVSAAKGVCGGDNPVFIRDTSRWFARHNVAEVTYWDYGTSRITATRNPRTRAALARYWVHPA